TDLATLRAEIAAVDAAVKGRGLDETFVHDRTGKELNLRMIYLHMIEEYARHLGHADLLRERIDGATGELPGRDHERHACRPAMQHACRRARQRGEHPVVDPAEAEGLGEHVVPRRVHRP